MAQKFVGEEALDQLIGFVKQYNIELTDWAIGDNITKHLIEAASKRHQNLWVGNRDAGEYYQLSNIKRYMHDIQQFSLHGPNGQFVYDTDGTTFKSTWYPYGSAPVNIEEIAADEVTNKFNS